MKPPTTADKMAFPPGYSARRAERDRERARMDALAREQYLAELKAKAFARGREEVRGELFRTLLRKKYSVEQIAAMLDLSCREVREAVRYSGRRLFSR